MNVEFGDKFGGFPKLILQKILYYHVSNNCYFCHNRRSEYQKIRECLICHRAICDILPICKDFCRKCKGVVCKRCQIKCPRCHLLLCLKCFDARTCCNILVCAGCERRITPIKDPTCGQGCDACGEFFCERCYRFCEFCRLHKCIGCSGGMRCNSCGLEICGSCQVSCDVCQDGTYCGPCLDANDAKCVECQENDESDYF